MKSETLALAIEALSWMELKRMNGRSALRSTAEQLYVRDRAAMGHAFRLIMETTRRRNALDHIITMALGEDGIEDLFLGKKNFLRIYASEAYILRKFFFPRKRSSMPSSPRAIVMMW